MARQTWRPEGRVAREGCARARRGARRGRSRRERRRRLGGDPGRRRARRGGGGARRLAGAVVASTGRTRRGGRGLHVRGSEPLAAGRRARELVSRGEGVVGSLRGRAHPSLEALGEALHRKLSRFSGKGADVFGAPAKAKEDEALLSSARANRRARVAHAFVREGIPPEGPFEAMHDGDASTARARGPPRPEIVGTVETTDRNR